MFLGICQEHIHSCNDSDIVSRLEDSMDQFVHIVHVGSRSMPESHVFVDALHDMETASLQHPAMETSKPGEPRVTIAD